MVSGLMIRCGTVVLCEFCWRFVSFMWGPNKQTSRQDGVRSGDLAGHAYRPKDQSKNSDNINCSILLLVYRHVVVTLPTELQVTYLQIPCRGTGV
jgi:hypothetical protein